MSTYDARYPARCWSMSRNETEDQAIAAIDNRRRFQSFVCLLVWQMSRQHRRRRAIMHVFDQIMRGVSFDDPASAMFHASKATRDQTRRRLLRALESSARALAGASWVPATLRPDYARFADVVSACRKRLDVDLTSEQIIEGLSGIMSDASHVDARKPSH